MPNQSTIQYLLTCLIAISVFPTYTKAEYFSSIDSIKTLDELELGLTETYREYVKTQQKEIQKYRSFLEQIKSQHDEAAYDGDEEFVANPINAYKLIKRVVLDWDLIDNAIKNDQALLGLRQGLDALVKETPMPDDIEIRGAVKGIARLQNMYNLNTTNLVDGVINGVFYGSLLNWDDCFEIAANLYEEKEFALAVNWFEETLKFLEEKNDLTVDDDSIRTEFLIQTYEYLALANYELANVESVVLYIENLLDLNSAHPFKGLQTYMKLKPPQAKKKPSNSQLNWYANYTRLCRGEQVPEKVHHKLKCKLETKNNPALLLTPLRTEELYIDPAVNLYHNLLSDNNIESILLEAGNNMYRSGVVNGSGTVVRDIRVSQQAWLEFTSPVMRKVARVVAQISGFNVSNSESMQMANYGIGGLYEAHHDYLENPELYTWWVGDRIATNMFYLSEVEHGGYTVFPHLNIYLRPVKGALVMWHNLHKSLDNDARTLHAGCPVIKGTKRIGNVWIHSGYQDSARPCDLENDSYKSIAYSYF